MLRGLLAPALVVVALACGSGAHADNTKTRRMTADAVKLKGLTLQKTLDVDLDGDGKRELVGVAMGKKGIQLVVIGENEDGAVVTDVLEPAGGKELAKIEARQLVPPAESWEVVLEVYDETPDEKIKRIRVYAGTPKLREVFTSVVHRPKNAEAGDAWDKDKSLVSYGDARPGWYFADIDDDGSSEIIVRRKPQILEVPQGTGDPVKLLIGVREAVYRWQGDANTGTYVEEPKERFHDFLSPALAIKGVTASSVWVDPKELKALKAKALSDALQKATDDVKNGKGKSTDPEAPPATPSLVVSSDAVAEDPNATPTKADAGKGAKAKGDTKTKGDKADKKAKGGKSALDEDMLEFDGDEPVLDLAAPLAGYVRRAADKDLKTAWIEGNVKSDGKGEWVELQLAEESPLKMVRIVEGCVDTAASYRAHNVPESFTLRLDDGSELSVDRHAQGKFDRGVLAFTDEVRSGLADRPWAKQTLVFFDGQRKVSRVRITLDKVLRQGKGDQACLSEVSVH